jgi:hypothetical protein
VEAARAQIGVAEANLRLAKAVLARAEFTASRSPGAVSPQEIEQDRAQVEQSTALVDLYKANLATAQLNLDWTNVKSPIAGQVSRYYLTVGNLVLADQTLLTTVVSLDPMYVYFDVDERTGLRVRKAINAGTIKPHGAIADVPVLMALEGDPEYQHNGHLNFVNNQVSGGAFGISEPRPGGQGTGQPGSASRRQLIRDPDLVAVAVPEHGDLAFESDHGVAGTLERAESLGLTHPARPAALALGRGQRPVLEVRVPAVLLAEHLAQRRGVAVGAVLGPALLAADVLAHDALPRM